MCATVVYPPTHPGLLHVRRATRMSFFVLHWREEERKNRGQGYFFQINQDRDTKGTSFLWEIIITLLLLASIFCVLTFCGQSVWDDDFLGGCVYGSVHRQLSKEDYCDRVCIRSISIGQHCCCRAKISDLDSALFVCCLLTATTSHDRQLRGRLRHTCITSWTALASFTRASSDDLACSFAVGRVTQAI
jgi:glycerol uptake facilitator-like aquaporin